MLSCHEIVQVSIPKSLIHQIRIHAAKMDGQQNSLNKFILRAIRLQMERDNILEETLQEEKEAYYKALHEAQEAEIAATSGFAE